MMTMLAFKRKWAPVITCNTASISDKIFLRGDLDIFLSDDQMISTQ